MLEQLFTQLVSSGPVAVILGILLWKLLPIFDEQRQTIKTIGENDTKKTAELMEIKAAVRDIRDIHEEGNEHRKNGREVIDRIDLRTADIYRAVTRGDRNGQ